MTILLGLMVLSGGVTLAWVGLQENAKQYRRIESLKAEGRFADALAARALNRGGPAAVIGMVLSLVGAIVLFESW